MTPASTVELLIPRADIAARVDALGAEVGEWGAEAASPPVLVGVLKGSAPFLADLIRAIPLDLVVDFMSISSYDPTPARSGVVRIVKDLAEDITGRDVVIVEDIVDTGLTLNYLRRSLEARHPRSLRAVTLLDKAARRIVPVELELAGFEIPDAFVIGYGLDFQGRYRNVPDILAVRDIARLANDPLLLAPALFASDGSRPAAQ